MPDPYKTPVDMQDVYDEDAQKNKEFDKTLNPDGSFKKPSLEQLKKGSEIKNKMLNQVRSTGFEVGANIGLDKATNWLLAAPFPGARLLYGGANFLGSAGINIQAQRIRGEEGIKWGEAGASGGMSLVPYMPFAAGKYTKYLGEPWSVQRGVVGGAVTGVGHEAIRVGIDEKRLPSPIETGLGATVGGAVGGAIPAAADTAKRMIAQIRGISPMGDLAYGLGGTGGASAMKGSGGGSVGSEINWNRYGYTPGTEPTQVRNVTIPELKTEVANSLDAFYQKTQEVVQSRVGSRASSSQIKNALKNQPQYWANPVTQKIYRAAWKGGLSKRYTLKPINRQYLEKQQSTAIQKQIQTQYQKDIQRKNIDLKKAWTDNEQGRWYTEHNVYLQSEKARNYILDNSGVRINDSSEFQLGNIANQTPRLENLKNPDTLVFRKVKNRFETVLDKTLDEYFQYPNYIVNSNPRLSGGREGIIRIEYSPIEWQQVPGSNPPIMRPVLTDFKVKGGILSGKSVVEIDTKDLDFIKNNLNTTEDVQNWLSREHGINPVAQGESFPRQGFEIRLSKSPVKSTQVQIKEFKKLIEEVQAGHKTWDEVFKEAGYEVIPQRVKSKKKLTAKQQVTKLRKQKAKQATQKATQARRERETKRKQGQGELDANL